MTEKKESTREEFQKKLQEKRQSNKRSYMDLMRMGAELDPTALLMMRVDTLIELILTEEQREMFELLFEQRLSGMIAQAKTEQAKDIFPTPIKRPGLILPS